MAVGERLHHILTAEQFSRGFLERELFPLADEMKGIVQTGGKRSLRDKRVGILFYEPSTRTRVSFEVATDFLGGKFFSTESAAQFSSAAKGESIEDTVRIYEGYSVDALVIRHNETGGVARAAEVANIPIINAGDGKGEHPTQALLDVYTIDRYFGGVDDLNIGVVGDLANGRTVNSLINIAGNFENIHFTLVSPPQFVAQPRTIEELKRNGLPFRESNDLAGVAQDLDVVYMTRPQLERMNGGDGSELFSGRYSITQEVLDILPKSSIIMHPLPRTGELPNWVDKDPRALYFRQAQNGLFIRMALLEMILAD